MLRGQGTRSTVRRDAAGADAHGVYRCADCEASLSPAERTPVLCMGRGGRLGHLSETASDRHPGGWNRIHLVMDDVAREVERPTAEGVRSRNEIVSGPGGAQVVGIDPAGNLVELFQPAAPPVT